jgi:arylsulfatase
MRGLREILVAPLSSRQLHGLAVVACGLVALVAGNCIGHAPLPDDLPSRTTFSDPNVAPVVGKDKIVFIVIDALRRDHLGMNGYERPTSPTLDRLASEGLVLDHLVVHASQTVPSMLAMLTSQLPSEHGVQYYASTDSFGPGEEKVAPRVAPTLETLPEVLAGAGFYPVGIVANPWLRHSYGFAQGYGHYTELDDGDGSDLTALAKEQLRLHRDHRTFLYLHYLDVHSPYRGYDRSSPNAPPFERPAEGRYRYHNGPVPDMSEPDLRYTTALYDEGIYRVDLEIAELLRFLEAEGIADETSIVIVSDHGDELMEHGGMGHGTTLHAELTNSFAILWSPGRFAPGRFRGCARGIDVVPTLLDAYGIPAPPTARGRSLRQGAAEGPGACDVDLVSELGSQKSVVSGGWKLVRRTTTGEEELSYVGLDGLPQPEPPTGAQEARAALQRKIDAIVARSAATGDAFQPVDPNTESRLRELGYLQ